MSLTDNKNVAKSHQHQLTYSKNHLKFENTFLEEYKKQNGNKKEKLTF